MLFLHLFLDICLFRKGPQDVPDSRFLLGLVLVFYLGVGTLLLAPDVGLGQAVWQTALEEVMDLALVGGLLATVGRLARFRQTVTALLATDALVSALAMPPLQMLAGAGGKPLAALLWLALLVWHIAIMAHILRHALSQPIGIGVAVAVLYTTVLFQVMAFLFPAV